MKKDFFTGLVILLPILLTIVIVAFLVNFLTSPFLSPIQNIYSSLAIFDEPFLIWDGAQILTFASKLTILVGLALVIILVGFFGKLFLIDYLFKWGDILIHNVPVINKIYKACQDVVHSLFSSESKSFSQVVFVPFPFANTLSVGLVSNDSIAVESQHNPLELVPVLVPGTPNPSVGFMLMFKRDELIYVDMKVDEAMKFVVSCGVVMNDFSIQTRVATGDSN